MTEKAGFKKQNSKRGFEKNEHAWSVEGVFFVSNSPACPYLKLAGPTRIIKAGLSSDKSEIDKQNPGHSAGARWHGYSEALAVARGRRF